METPTEYIFKGFPSFRHYHYINLNLAKDLKDIPTYYVSCLAPDALRGLLKIRRNSF